MWVSQNKGAIYLVMLPIRTILSTGVRNTSKLTKSIFSGNAELQSEKFFQVFWFLCNLFLVAALNFVVNLTQAEISDFPTKYSHKYPVMEAIFKFFALDEVEIIKDTLAFNAVIGLIICFGSMSIMLYFTQIKNYKPKIKQKQIKLPVFLLTIHRK